MGARATWRPAGPECQPVATTEKPSGRLVHEYILATKRAGEGVLACARCGHRLCSHGGNYKSGALVHETPVTAIPTAQDPAFYLDDIFVFRRYCCPGCHVQIATEIARADEAPFSEMLLADFPAQEFVSINVF